MIDSLFSGTAIPALEQVVRFTQARHGVLAGNVANLDTPGYRTRDLSVGQFQEKLQAAIDAGRQPPPTRSGPGKPISLYGSTYAPRSSSSVKMPEDHQQFAEVEETLTSILYHDESDVAIEKQVSELAKNQALHNLALSLMVSQFQLLEAAISEQVA